MLLGSTTTTKRFLLTVSLMGGNILEAANDFPKAPGAFRALTDLPPAAASALREIIRSCFSQKLSGRNAPSRS